MSLPWKNVWIVGASSGIGRELAILMDEGSTRIAVSARSEEALRELAARGRSIAVHPLDVVDAKSVANCVAE